MFAKLKKFLVGDKRPIARSFPHPVIGTMTYTEDDEAWLTDPRGSSYGFGFYISCDWDADGPEIRPAGALVEHAAAIASHPEEFIQTVQQFVESQLLEVRALASD